MGVIRSTSVGDVVNATTIFVPRIRIDPVLAPTWERVRVRVEYAAGVLANASDSLRFEGQDSAQPQIQCSLRTATLRQRSLKGPTH